MENNKVFGKDARENVCRRSRFREYLFRVRKFILDSEICLILIAFIYYWSVRRWRSGTVRRFIILAQERTGGTLLVNLLNSHPMINCDGEILYRRKRFFLSSFLAGKSILLRKKEIYGLRVTIKQLLDHQKMRDPGSFLVNLHKRGWKIIYLRRENFLRQAISEFVAKHRGRYERHLSDPQENITIRLDCEVLLRSLEKKKFFSQAEQRALSALPCLTVVYEDNLLKSENHQEALDRIFDYLGTTRFPVKTNLAKVTPEKLSSFIENYKEVVKAVRDAGYGKFLDDNEEIL